MRNIFADGSSKNGFSISSPTVGGFRPVKLGQVTSEAMSPARMPHTMGPNDMPQGHPEETKPAVMPATGARARRLDNPRARFEWAVGRLCSVMRHFADQDIPDDAKSHIFWSYVKNSNSSEESVLTAYKTLCPELPVPPKPTTPDKELVAESPDKAGFHGKTTLSFDEASQLKDALDVVLMPLTPDETAKAINSQDCLRDLAAGNYPKVEALRDDLADFIAAGDKNATFEISKGDVVVTGKAIDCAVAIGRGKTIKTALTAGGVIGAGALLLLLL